MPNIKTNLQPGDKLDGFLVKMVTPLEDLRMTAYQLEHQKSGARLMHLYANDTENLFSISFPTPPPDDTGIPHILEHSVLSGSRKYPVRDPFFEMYKMSMATFINAMTGWDCTYYPVASNVKQDLFNLAEVYYDAVFHPLLTEQTFKREGHHFAPASKDDPLGDLTINGIVYNEMKGSFSDPESKLYRRTGRGLFPDTIYGRESGGDPKHIPDLTYTNFKRFHQTYYHPGNAYFFFYGNIPTEEYLSFLNNKLDVFEKSDPQYGITKQPRWSKPQIMEDSYPIGKDETAAEKTYVSIIWLIGDATDVQDLTCHYILSQILLGNEAAPLKKAIIDSKLGQDLIYSGFSTMGLETTFRVGLKGTEPDRADKFVDLVLKTLTNIADSHVEIDRIEAAFQQAAYHYLEILPLFPVYMMDRVLDAWIYNADPLTFLRMNKHLDDCRRRYEADPKLFNNLIHKRILENRHRLTFLLKPDRKWQAKIDVDFTQRMQQVRAKFSDDVMKKISEEADELERISGQPNSPEALAKLPQLKVKNLPTKPKHIPTTIEQLNGGVELLRNDVFSNGVNYLHLDFNLKGLPADLWPYLPRYTSAIRKLGAAGMNFEQVASGIASSTGGISCRPYFNTHTSGPDRSLWSLRFKIKVLDGKIDPALALLHDLIFELNPRDKNRLHDVLVQAQARYRTKFVHRGSDTAARHAARGFSPQAYLSEIVNGLPQLSLTEVLTNKFDQLNPDIMDNIEKIRNFLLVRRRLTASFTGSEHVYKIVRSRLSDWINEMRDEPINENSINFTPYKKLPREGLAGPIQVAHCARIFPAPHFSHPDEALLRLGARLISLEYMLNEIRFKGNAYGAWFGYNSIRSKMQLGSYSDPHVVRTLRVFDNVVDYVQKADWTQTDVNRAIIGSAKHAEKPIRPEEATGFALHRHLTGHSPELREERYLKILSATAEEVKRAMLEQLDSNFSRSAVCVVSNREKLEEANQQMPEQTLSIEDIL